MRGVGFVYYVQRSDDERLIKIGWSTQVLSRLMALTAAEKSPLVLRAVEIAIGASAEHLRHRQFGHLRVRGEWFLPDHDLVDHVERVRELAPSIIELSRIRTILSSRANKYKTPRFPLRVAGGVDHPAHQHLSES